MELTKERLTKQKRQFYDEDLDVSNWENIEKEMNSLINAPIDSPHDLILQMEKKSELKGIVMLAYTWAHIKMTCDTESEEYKKNYKKMSSEILPKLDPLDFALMKKFYESPYLKELPEQYDMYVTILKNNIEIYREENIELQVKERDLISEYKVLASKRMAEYKGEEKTYIQLNSLLEDPSREVRKEVWHLLKKIAMDDEPKVNELYDKMKELRVQMAKNAGFDNYRDYIHKAKGRFSYTPDNLFTYHKSIEKVVLPLVREIYEKKKQALGYDKLYPWDASVDEDFRKLKPFEDTRELVAKGIAVMNKVKPEFALQVNQMDNTGFFDLDNRKGKGPGGYCAAIYDHNSSFIFMNSVGEHRNLKTLFHEIGHAMHNYCTRDQKLITYRRTPLEAAELASMTMEFFTMEHWNEYYKDEADYKKAVKEQLINCVSSLPRFSVVDLFQHWIYTNPDHTAEERTRYYLDLLDRFDTGIYRKGFEKEYGATWTLIHHIVGMPFYMIEYSFARLGSLAIYKNYKENPKKALEQYENFLTLGYTKPLPQLYEAAGIKFDYSQEYLGELMEFVREELKRVE